jgi:hypothetical protein
MKNKKIYVLLREWLKITLFAFLSLSLITVLMLVLFTIIRVLTFVIGNDVFWILRWYYEPDRKFAIQFNPVSFFIIAAITGFVGLWLRKKKLTEHRRSQRR